MYLHWRQQCVVTSTTHQHGSCTTHWGHHQDFLKVLVHLLIRFFEFVKSGAFYLLSFQKLLVPKYKDVTPVLTRSRMRMQYSKIQKKEKNSNLGGKPQLIQLRGIERTEDKFLMHDDFQSSEKIVHFSKFPNLYVQFQEGYTIECMQQVNED